MSESSKTRRSARMSVSKSYEESPIESPRATRESKTVDHSIAKTPTGPKIAKTQKSRRNTTSKISNDEVEPPVKPKLARKLDEEPEVVSPKKRKSGRPKTPSKMGLESIAQENSPTIVNLDSNKIRRSSLRPRRTITELHEQQIKTPSTSRTPKESSKVEDEIVNLDSSNGSNGENVDTNIQRPTTLFDEEEDVDGKSIISFKTPKKQNSMVALAQLTPKTPRHDKGTPRRSSSAGIQKTPTSRPCAQDLAKTPRHIREKYKKKLGKVQQVDSDADFSSGSSDEFSPHDEGHSSSSEDDSEGENEDEAEVKSKKPLSVSARVLKTPATSLGRGRRGQKDFQLILRSDNYFASASSKSKTSDHTLDRLKNARLPHDQLLKLLSTMELSDEHKKSVKSLNEEHKTNFDKWLTLFDEGFTVLLHGLGSKRNLLQAFHKEKLANEHVIVINGFFPSLTIKDILDSILEILEISASGNPHEVVSAIEEEMLEIPALNLFMIVHNIEGSMLRNDRAQGVLSRLASIRNLHMIASIDHINTPLIWNNTKLSNYNFIWFDVTTFLPYTEETSFENSFMVQNSGTLELSSMKSVFQSLTTNARKIFILVVKNQLKNTGNSNYQGISFKELYSASREEFLVSSDVALRAQLTEFLDHKLAKLKRTIDGTENITIPLRNSLLEQFLNEQN